MVHYTYKITNKNSGEFRLQCITADNALEADTIIEQTLKVGETYECIEYKDTNW